MAILERPAGRVPSLLAKGSVALFRLGGTLSVGAEIRRDEQPKILLPYSFRVLVVTSLLCQLTPTERAHGGERR